MSFALKVAGTGRVALVCKTTLDEANTALAQGGVASVTNLEVDDFDGHIHDTMVGDGFERSCCRGEGGEGRPVNGVHADKKNTGFEIQESLIEAVRRNPSG